MPMLRSTRERWVWSAFSKERNNVCVQCQWRIQQRRQAHTQGRQLRKNELTSISQLRYSRALRSSNSRAQDRAALHPDSQKSRVSTVLLGERDDGMIGSDLIHDGTRIGHDLLHSAYQHGLIQINSAVGTQLLTEARSLGCRFDKVALKDFCKRHILAIDDVYLLSRLLLRSKDQSDRHFGWIFLRLSSILGSATATIHLLKRLLRDKDFRAKSILPELRSSFDHLLQLAKHDPPITPALVLQADIERIRGEVKIAKARYLKAIEIDPSTTDSNLRSSISQRLVTKFLRFFRQSREEEPSWGMRQYSLGQDPDLDIVAAHVKLGSLLYFSQSTEYEKKSGIQHWRIAALDYDDPMAYFYLAEDLRSIAVAKARREALTGAQRAGGQADVACVIEVQWLWYSSIEWYNYALKAAASGHSEACYQIGLLFLLPVIYPHLNCGGITDPRLRLVVSNHPLFKPRPWDVARAMMTPASKTFEYEFLGQAIDESLIGVEWLTMAKRLGYHAVSQLLRDYHGS